MKKWIHNFLKTLVRNRAFALEVTPSICNKKSQDTKNHSALNIPLLIKQRTFQINASENLTEKVAVFFDLEYLEESAITSFSIKTFCPYPENFHIFTKFSDALKANQVLQQLESMLQVDLKVLSIFDADNYESMDEKFQYIANIFVLGDSHYNLKSLEYAIKLYAHRGRNYLYFHDGLYTNLLFSWVIKHYAAWQDLALYYYPELTKEDSITTEDLLKKNIYMIQPLMELTGSSHIFVNADNCIPIIEKELGKNQVFIKSAFLPISDFSHVLPAEFGNDDTLIIAHFGIPNRFKQIDKLIHAVGILQQKHTRYKEISLLFAGYGVADYVKQLPTEQQQYIVFEESPSSDRMHALMKRTDVTVQLRYPILGQSSGVISEMLGLGLKCITTRGFVNKALEDFVAQVEPDIESEQLADIILQSQGKMLIPVKDHIELLQHFSCEASANLLFNTVVSQAKVPIKPLNKKLRILYGATHRILRFEEVPLFLQAGFEVIPIKAHWEIFKIQEPGADDPSHPLYPKWREYCTIPNDIIENIQAIDLLSYQNLHADSGRVSPAEVTLLNQWIDIIYIPNLLPTVPRVLEWFEGLTLFRVFGEGKIMTYDEWAVSSGADLTLLKQYDKRYAAMLLLHALNGKEHESILGTNVFHVNHCVTRSRITEKWKGEQSSRVCNTTLSYITENPHWTDIYHEFNQIFTDMPLRILGKNYKSHEPLKSDDRVVGIIENDEQYLQILSDCRCFVDSGTSPFHMPYAPLEAIIMGIPVIFLESSGLAEEIIRVIPKAQLENCGICENFSEAAKVVQRCLDDINFAMYLSENQKIIAEKMFLPEHVLQQIKQFANEAPVLVANARSFSASLKRS